MTWTSFHRRADVLRAVITTADARRDGSIPRDVDGVLPMGEGNVFADDLDLLGALQLTWHTRLMGRIERRQLHQPTDLEASVVGAWHDATDELPGVRAVLDHNADHPDATVRDALARAATKERLALALASGRGNLDDRASLAVGTRIEERARASYLPVRPSAPTPGPGRATLFDRLRAALAA